MSRSARLKNIATGLCGSFAGRNNDLAGYWAIGKLRSLAESSVSINLLTKSMQPQSSKFAQMLEEYHLLLQKLAHRSGVPLEEITAANIFVDFSPQPWPRALYYQQQWGEQFLVTVTISADGRAEGINSHTGYCRPHDPARESRRCSA